MALELINSYMLSLEINRTLMHIKKNWTIFFLILLCIQSISCGYPETPMRQLRGPNDKVELVFFYKKGTTYEAKRFFEDNIVHKPNLDGKGHALQEGVTGLFSIRNSDFEGFAIEFSPQASEERQKLKKAIEQSPIVYKVYEDVVPNQIKDL